MELVSENVPQPNSGSQESIAATKKDFKAKRKKKVSESETAEEVPQ